MSRAGLGRLLALLVVLSLAGCAGRTIVPGPPSPPGAPDALRASVRGRMDHGGRSLRFQVDVALRTPGRLRAEISGPVGGVKAILSIQEGRVTALFPGTKEFLDEPALPATVESLIGLPLDPETLIDLFNFPGGRGDELLRIPSSGDGPPHVLAVHREPDRLLVAAQDPPRDGFARLDLRLERGERPAPSTLSEGLFLLTVPEGWSRLSAAARDDGRPVLMP